MQNGKATYLPLVAPTANAPAKAKIVLRLVLKNTGASPVTLKAIQFAFPGSSVALVNMLGEEQFFAGYYEDAGKSVLAPGQSKTYTNGRVKLVPDDDDSMVDNMVYVPLPAPGSIQVRVHCQGFAEPATVTLPLAAHKSPTPEGSYLFPFHASDLRVGEYFVGSARHWANGGANGTQIFAHDLGVEGWDAARGTLSKLLPGKSGTANEHFRIYGKPVRALADGIVDACHDGMADNQVIGEFPEPTPSPGSGNFLRITHGSEKVTYCHLQSGSIPTALKAAGAAVKAGQVIGRVGNSGNSKGPHTHIEAVGTDASKPLRPLPFRAAHAIDPNAFSPPNPAGPWSSMDGRGISVEKVAIWPAASEPAWYPPGWREVAHHAIPASSYQTIFDRAVSSGYRPVWLDGYEVNGATYFNVIFRPQSGSGWVARHGMSALEYQEEFNSWVKQGYRLTNLTSYVSGGSARYAAIFDKVAGPAWRAYHGLNAADHQQKFDAWVFEGYRPVNVTVTAPGGTPSFAGFYVQQDVGGFVHQAGLTAEQYQRAWNENTAAGRELAYLNAYQQGGAPRFSAIFQQKVAGSGGTIGRHGLTGSAYPAEFTKRTSEGYLTRVVVGYEEGGAARFAAAWRKA